MMIVHANLNSKTRARVLVKCLQKRGYKLPVRTVRAEIEVLLALREKHREWVDKAKLTRLYKDFGPAYCLMLEILNYIDEQESYSVPAMWEILSERGY